MRPLAGFLVLSLAAAGLGLALPAAARDIPVPDVALRIGDHSRALHPWSWSWTYRAGPRCVGEEADGFPTFRPMVGISARVARPAIVFHKRARPHAVQITGFRRLDQMGAPAGRGHTYLPRLRPRTRGGEIEAWVARPRIRVGDRRFLELNAAWPDRSGCALGEDESASWSFGLRLSGG